MKTAIILLTWGRPKQLETTLRALNSQTLQNFDLIVSNSNRDHDTYLRKVIKQNQGPYKTIFRADPNDRYTFRRFDIARELDYDRYIFIDDDVHFNTNLTADMDKQYKPRTYLSWYCWQIHTRYHDRTRVISPNQRVDYAGAGVSIIDRAVFDREELYDCPPAALYIDDLWLSYIFSHVLKWPIKLLQVPRVKLGGGDQFALFRKIRDSNYTKDQFLEDLRARGWSV